MSRKLISCLIPVIILWVSCNYGNLPHKHQKGDTDYVIYAKDSSSAMEYWIHGGDTQLMSFTKEDIKNGQDTFFEK